MTGKPQSRRRAPLSRHLRRVKIEQRPAENKRVCAGWCPSVRQLALAVGLALGAGCVDLARPDLGCTDHCDAAGVVDGAQTAALPDANQPPGTDLRPATDAGAAADLPASGLDVGTDLPGPTGEETGAAPPLDGAVPADAASFGPE